MIRWPTELNLDNAPSFIAIALFVWGIVKGVAALVARYKKRGFTVERTLTSAPDIGNDVTIVNLSDKPLMISAWDIVWARWRPWGKHITCGAADGDDDSYGLTIPPYDRHRFGFVGEYYFDTGAKTRAAKGRLYMRIWIAGQRGAHWFKLL